MILAPETGRNLRHRVNFRVFFGRFYRFSSEKRSGNTFKAQNLQPDLDARTIDQSFYTDFRCEIRQAFEDSFMMVPFILLLDSVGFLIHPMPEKTPFLIGCFSDGFLEENYWSWSEQHWKGAGSTDSNHRLGCILYAIKR